jgi:Protein of unknown function (DUF2948)
MTGLRLLAEDAEDLKILSAHLQDAVLRVGDIVYLPKHRRFAALLSRYCWGDDCGKGNSGVRVRAGLHFDDVLRVQSQNVRQDDPEALVSLLAIDFTPGADGGGTVDLILAGGGCIKLQVECVDATLRDLSEPRPAVARPAHNVEAG